MTNAEVRLLRFIHAASAHALWVPYKIVKNTDDLLPGDEKALPGLITRGLVEEGASREAYRATKRASRLSDAPKRRDNA